MEEPSERFHKTLESVVIANTGLSTDVRTAYLGWEQQHRAKTNIAEEWETAYGWQWSLLGWDERKGS